MERESQIAIMREQAHRMKKPKASDLYKRPLDDDETFDIDKHVEKAEHASEWISQFDFTGEEDDS